MEDDALIFNAAFSQFTPAVTRLPGDFDLYLTERGNITTISAPLQLDLTAGGVFDVIAVDTADPAVLELVSIPVP